MPYILCFYLVYSVKFIHIYIYKILPWAQKIVPLSFLLPNILPKFHCLWTSLISFFRKLEFFQKVFKCSNSLSFLSLSFLTSAMSTTYFKYTLFILLPYFIHYESSLSTEILSWTHSFCLYFFFNIWGSSFHFFCQVFWFQQPCTFSCTLFSRPLGSIFIPVVFSVSVCFRYFPIMDHHSLLLLLTFWLLTKVKIFLLSLNMGSSSYILNDILNNPSDILFYQYTFFLLYYHFSSFF